MPDKREKIVFLDFCGTCVPFQSADRFVYFVVKNYATPLIKARVTILNTLRYMHLVERIERWSKHRVTLKKLILYQIKGMSQETIDNAARRYFDEIIFPALIPEISHEVHKRLMDGYRVIIVSGGYDVYLRYFMKYLGGKLDDVLATPLLFVNGKFSGKMGLDCMGENKISYIKKHIKGDRAYSIAYSDSLSDIPLFKYATEAYLVQPERDDEGKNSRNKYRVLKFDTYKV